MDVHLTPPAISRRAKVRRMASAGISDYQITALLGIQLSTLKLFFPRELELGAIIAALRFPKKVQPKPQPEKPSYMSEGPPPGTLIICGPNGQEISN